MTHTNTTLLILHLSPTVLTLTLPTDTNHPHSRTIPMGRSRLRSRLTSQLQLFNLRHLHIHRCPPSHGILRLPKQTSVNRMRRRMILLPNMLNDQPSLPTILPSMIPTTHHQIHLLYLRQHYQRPFTAYQATLPSLHHHRHHH